MFLGRKCFIGIYWRIRSPAPNNGIGEVSRINGTAIFAGSLAHIPHLVFFSFVQRFDRFAAGLCAGRHLRPSGEDLARTSDLNRKTNPRGQERIASIRFSRYSTAVETLPADKGMYPDALRAL